MRPNVKLWWLLQTLLMAPLGVMFLFQPWLANNDPRDLLGKVFCSAFGAILLYVEARIWQIRLHGDPNKATLKAVGAAVEPDDDVAVNGLH